MTESLLQNCTGVIEEPYPHIIIENALSQDYYDELRATFPSWKQIIPHRDWKANNVRGNIPYSQTMLGPYPEIWKDFFKYHASREFYLEFIYWFGPYIRELLPKVEQQYGKLEDIPIETKRPGGIAGRGKAFIMDVLFSANSPVQKESRVRDKHIDLDTKLTAGLFYMPEADDDAGGNLEIYECHGEPTYPLNDLQPECDCAKERAAAGEPWHGYHNISYPTMNKVKEVEYKPNTLAILLNTMKSVHAVSPRKPTDKPRTFINLFGEFNKDII